VPDSDRSARADEIFRLLRAQGVGNSSEAAPGDGNRSSERAGAPEPPAEPGEDGTGESTEPADFSGSGRAEGTVPPVLDSVGEERADEDLTVETGHHPTREPDGSTPDRHSKLLDPTGGDPTGSSTPSVTTAPPATAPGSDTEHPAPPLPEDHEVASTASAPDGPTAGPEPATGWVPTQTEAVTLAGLAQRALDEAGERSRAVERPSRDDAMTGAGETAGAIKPGHPGARHVLPRRFAIANQKGGVGKTTTAVNLGAALAELGYRVLVVDLDPQGNATTGLGINARNLAASIYDVMLHGAALEDVIEPTNLRNLFAVPATIDLAGAEIELVPVFSRELRLRKALDSVEGDFDFVLIDCPPSLGLLTVNGLAAASEVIVPIQCEYYALEGLTQLLRNVNLVRANLNETLEVSTIILTMYDARTRLAEQVVGEVREHFGDRVCRNIVPRTVRLSEAPGYGQPIVVFDPSSRGAIAYRELAKEVSGGAPQRTR